MRTGRPKKPLEIVDADREKLSMIARRPKSAQAMALRARIVLSCEPGMSNSEVARKLHITGATVGKWRERMVLPCVRTAGTSVGPGRSNGRGPAFGSHHLIIAGHDDNGAKFQPLCKVHRADRRPPSYGVHVLIEYFTGDARFFGSRSRTIDLAGRSHENAYSRG